MHRMLIRISLKFVPNSPIDKNSFVQIMSWHRTGAKPLSEPMIAWVTDVYMRHSVSGELISEELFKRTYLNLYRNTSVADGMVPLYTEYLQAS